MKKIFFIIILFFGSLSSLNAEIKRIISGNVNAKITIIAYESLTCSHCATFHKKVYPKLKIDFIDTGLEGFPFAVVENHNYIFELSAIYAAISFYFLCAGPGRLSLFRWRCTASNLSRRSLEKK